MSGLTAEFALAAACCRWPPSPQRQVLITHAAAAVDWSLFCAIVRRHRIEGLVWEALRNSGVQLPDAEAKLLRAEARRIARMNLLIAAECRRLAAEFKVDGVPLLFVKGLTVAKLAYGGISLKKGWDIDLLVAPETLSEAAQLLLRLGYQSKVPAEASMEGLHAWHRRSKESVWRHLTKGHIVELHTSLVNSSYLLPNVGMQSGTVDVEVVEGVVLPTLPADQLFAYLCVHGASSAWFRLKWLADLAALTGGDATETDRLYQRAYELGAGRAAAQALLLAADLLGVPLSAQLGSALSASRANRILAAAAKRLMVGREPERELHNIRFGTSTIHWTQFLLLPGRGYLMAEFRRQWCELMP